MITALNIKNFALVEQLNLEFENGMISLTGETGAGKSIILGAIALILGDNVKKGAVRYGEEKAIISATFNVSNLPKVQSFLKEHDYIDENNINECIIRRVIRSDGKKSSAFINDSVASISKIKEIGEMLVEIHGQHQHQLLSKEKNQLDILDSFCELKEKRKEVSNLYKEWKKKEIYANEVKNNFDENYDKFKLLDYQRKELKDLNLSKDEFKLLEEEFEELSSAEHSISSCNEAINYIKTESYDSYDDILTLLNKSIKTIQGINSEKTKDILESLENAKIELEEVCPTIESFRDRYEINPERLYDVELRLKEINKASDSFNVLPEDLYFVLDEIEEKIQNLNFSEDIVQKAHKDVEIAFSAYLESSIELSKLRKEGAIEISRRISEEASKLKLADNIFKVHFYSSFENILENKYSSTGIDSINFYIRPNKGQDYQPLKEIASGGELSRLSLAIQVVSLKNDRVPTMIFDEVDAGLSGETGNVVGEMLRKVGSKTQVFCVTHLPQVAAQGHYHYFVSKSDVERNGNIITISNIEELNKDTRIKEIARMIGGDINSKESFKNAEIMLSMSK